MVSLMTPALAALIEAARDESARLRANALRASDHRDFKVTLAAADQWQRRADEAEKEARAS